MSLWDDPNWDGDLYEYLAALNAEGNVNGPDRN